MKIQEVHAHYFIKIKGNVTILQLFNKFNIYLLLVIFKLFNNLLRKVIKLIRNYIRIDISLWLSWILYF